MNYIYGEQISKIPAKLYNDDAQVKYLDFGSLYTNCCHDSKEHRIRTWLRERIYQNQLDLKYLKEIALLANIVVKVLQMLYWR